MNWERLLSSRRLGDIGKSTLPPTSNGRSEFQRDFDRVVFSSAFRRLQDKTQVFPLPESDFVHNRLTHSLEVSCIGRSLGNLVGERILERHSELNDNFTKFHFGEIVAAACLAHDIGNPPFGHSGEDSIAEYFKHGNGKQFEKTLSDEKKWNDFIKFEGNAQGFRIITKLQNPTIFGGLCLTAATLSALTKYPQESYISHDASTGLSSQVYKKYGFFQSEKDLFREVALEVGLIKNCSHPGCYFWSRHPLSFLVEAADDITYRIMDLEDGFHLGLESFNRTEELLRALIDESTLKSYNGRDNNDKIGYLRAKAMSSLVNQLSEIFSEEEERILEGKLSEDLINLIPSADVLKEIKTVSKEEIYSYKSVIERETAGYEVLGGLLDIFITAVNAAAEGNASHKNAKVLQLLPKQFLNPGGIPENDLYLRLLRITDYISGMTDSYAISLFRRVKGISLASI
ncbi:MAG: deoxyguanosinetriphosphate triphosphohydrolase [Ignavibacteria bacterium]|jgi:dGTPase|nr:deoxyguanosinetriphosphate triphosphohydrolase [Ignavibacteria bacterium]MCU7502289.1 deoxyguanosinetriphosphate triphosphohydrolase [Ignavibacteria bacterium]MCU7516667.1 deoxyguanosinetriphosphate triphosphohydrolase [Ignavibacteria bacterium]